MSSLKFGTSGLRGLVVDLLGWPSYAYSRAFLGHMALLGEGADAPGHVLVGRDLRSSSPEIAGLAIAASRAAGLVPLDCGAVPTPALALAALTLGHPAIMVTGSHIPDDRNGLKFYRPDGEISKADEAGILRAFAALGEPAAPGAIDLGARAAAYDALPAYRSRYLDFFPAGFLAGLTIGVYQQSSVARDVIAEVLRALGAKVEPLGRSHAFIPVDTEAHRPEDKALILAWAKGGGLDAIVSADGDGDRPLVADETGAILRGDIVGLITAGALGLETIVTPVTSSSAIERSGVGRQVVRTKVGSPFVIAAMGEAAAPGAGGIIGFEANGGVLLGSDVEDRGRRLPALPTRDAMLPIVAVLGAVLRQGMPLSGVVAALNAGHAAAGRLPDVPAERSAPFIRRLGSDKAFRDDFLREAGTVLGVNETDGARLSLADGSILHYRASGNAPELRCYTEAGDAGAAERLLAWGLDRAGLIVKA